MRTDRPAAVVLLRARLVLWATAFAAAAGVGLPASHPLGPAVAALAVGPAVGLALFVLLARAAPTLRLPPRPVLFVLARAAYLLGAAAFEEIVWRGAALAALVPLLGAVGGLVLTSIGFAAAHRRLCGRRCARHMLTGAGFGAAFLSAGLAAAIAAHAVYNLLVDLAVQARHAPMPV